jgi:TP901 family phage tail tape measure protein
MSGMSSISSADALMSKFFTTVDGGNASLNQLGKTLVLVSAGAIAMAGGIAMVNAAIDNVQAYADYEESLSITQGLIGATREEMAGLEEQAFSLARTTRYTAGESMDAYYELASAGLSMREMDLTLEATLKGSVIGMMEAADGADMITTAMRAYQIPAEEAMYIMDRLTVGTRLSKIHFDEYAQAFGKFGSVMNSTNQSFEDSIALFGVMRTGGLSPSSAAMMIKMMGTHLIGMSDANAQRLRELNVELFDSVGNMRDLPSIMRDLFAAMPIPSDLLGRTDLEEGDIQEYAQGRLKTFTDIFGMRAVAGLMSVFNAQVELNGQMYTGVDAVEAMSAEIQAAGGFTEEYYALLADTINERVKIMQSTIDLIKVSIGDALANSLKPVMDQIQSALTYVSEFLTANPEIAKNIGYALAIGGVLLAAGGFIVVIAGIIGILAGIAGIGSLIGYIVLAIAGIVAAVGIVAGVGALVAANWEKVKGFFIALGDWMWGKFGFIIKAIVFMGIAIFEVIIKPIWWMLKNVVAPVLLTIFAVVSIIIGLILIGLDVIWGLAQTIFAFFESLFTWDWSYFETELDRIWGGVADDVKALGELFFSTILDAIWKLADSLSGGQFSAMSAAGEAGSTRGVLGATAGRWGGMWDQAWGMNDILDPSNYASGTTRVPRDGLVYAHEDEEIVQRGGRSNNNSSGVSIGSIIMNSYGKEEPEEFAKRTYQAFKRMMSEDREAVAHV